MMCGGVDVCSQCVVLATRPLLFSFLKMRLDALGIIPTPASSLGSARILLQMCIESSQQILNVLAALKSQSLLGATWNQFLYQLLQNNTTNYYQKAFFHST
jgi:hypothetical protein